MKVAPRRALIPLLVVLTAGCTFAPLPLPGPGTSTFDARRSTALEAIAAVDVSSHINAKHTYWVAQAKLGTAKTEDGLRVLAATLGNGQGAMFRVWALADTYGRWQHVMTDEMKVSAREQLVRYVGYGGGATINHYLMYATARYLAGSYFPDREFRADFRPHDPTGRDHLLAEMAHLTQYGIQEFDSPGYSALYLGVARSLADLAPDAALRNAARQALDTTLLSLAGEWLDGHLLSGSLRDPRAADGQHDFSGADYVMWLYTGGGATPDFNPDAIAEEAGLAHVVIHALGGYVPPLALLERIGTERTSRTYTHLDTDAWGQRRFYQTAFVNRTYGLYSTYESYDVHTGFSQQYHRWGVRWLSPAAVSSFWLKHPHPTAGTEGTTGYEKVLQSGGALIGVYNVPGSHPVQHVAGHVPTGHLAFVDESDQGALYLRYDSVLIALRATSPFDWDPGSPSLVIPNGRFGFAVETARPDEYPGDPAEQLAAFARDLAPHDLEVVGGTTLAYVTRAGTALSVSASGVRHVDGQALDLSSWPLVSDPWVHRAVGTAATG